MSAVRDALLLIVVAAPAIVGLIVLAWGIATIPLPARTVYDDIDAMRCEREAQERAVRTCLYRPSGRVETSTVNAPAPLRTAGRTSHKEMPHG